MDFDWSVILTALPALAQGAKLTVFITVVGLAGGVAVGLLFGLMRAYGNKALSGIAFGYVEFVRGTPIVVQVMFIYFALPVLLNVRVDAMTAAITAIVVNSGAYIAEIVRGAFLSVPRGLREAGLALGMPTWRVLAFVVGPVAFRRMTPPLGNQFIVSLKDTSLFIVIGVGELTRQGQEIMAANFRAVEIWSAVAAIYLVMIGVLTFSLRMIERRMRILRAQSRSVPARSGQVFRAVMPHALRRQPQIWWSSRPSPSASARRWYSTRWISPSAPAKSSY